MSGVLASNRPPFGEAIMRPVEINLATLATLFRKEFELCNVKKGETIAVVSDLNRLRRGGVRGGGRARRRHL
jgi:hypothetical protein